CPGSAAWSTRMCCWKWARPPKATSPCRARWSRPPCSACSDGRHPMNNSKALGDIARFLRRLQWALVALATGWLVWLMGPILTPFVVAALLGWLGDPLVDRLERAGRSRNVAVVLVFALMALLLALALLILLPTLQRQVATLVQSLPHYRDWFAGTAIP